MLNTSLFPQSASAVARFTRVSFFLSRASLLAFLHRFSAAYFLGTIFQIGKPNYR